MTVDIIMPCYYSNEIIRPAFEMIANQTAIKNITLIIVNDCSPNTDCEYQDIIKEYSDRIKIHYFKTETNCGPGCAKQFGLDNAVSDLVLFHDDDDTLYDIYSVENLLKVFDTYKLETVCEVIGQLQIINRNNQIVSCCSSANHQGKIYNRKFLQDNNIHYEKDLSFKEEDGLFQTLISLKQFEYKSVYIDDIIYCKYVARNHISITERSSMIDSFLAMFGLKVYPLYYILTDEEKIDLSLVKDISLDAISYIPLLLRNLKFSLEKFNFRLSTKQYKLICKYIDIYNKFLQTYTINIFTIPVNDLRMNTLAVFDFDSFFGEFDINIIYQFNDSYLKWLNELKELIED